MTHALKFGTWKRFPYAYGDRGPIRHETESVCRRSGKKVDVRLLPKRPSDGSTVIIRYPIRPTLQEPSPKEERYAEAHLLLEPILARSHEGALLKAYTLPQLILSESDHWNKRSTVSECHFDKTI